MSDKNYYEILNISPDTFTSDMASAYARARELYGKDSVALYSLYSEQERMAMLESIENAYKTLSDPEKRRLYDEKLKNSKAYSKATAEVSFPNISETSHMPRRVSKFKNNAHMRQTILESIAGRGACSEQYRELLTKLEHISRKHSYSVFAVTSAVKGEGKTVTSVNLSMAMTKELKMRVLLMECDMRSPSFADYFEFAGDIPGLREILDSEATLDEAVAVVDGTELHVIHGGRDVRSVPDSMSQGMKKLMDRVRLEFDYVILDTPPIAPVADVKILSQFVDGLLMVVRSDSTPRDMVLRAVKSLPNANIVGIVLNRIKKSIKQYY